MLSQNDMIFYPEEYQPLGSIKALLNKSHEPDFVDVDVKKLFNSDPNQRMLCANLFKIHRQNGGRSTWAKFEKIMPKLVSDFSSQTDFDQYALVEENANGFQNWAEVLRALNDDFMQYCYKKFRWNHMNPFREYIEVGDSANRKQKKMSELLAHDIPTIDLWREQSTQISNRVYRYDNQIPVWQRSIFTRHYDRSNEGLRTTADRASLENQIHGYNMRNIEDVIDKWRSEDWFGM